MRWELCQVNSFLFFSQRLLGLSLGTGKKNWPIADEHIPSNDPKNNILWDEFWFQVPSRFQSGELSGKQLNTGRADSGVCIRQYNWGVSVKKHSSLKISHGSLLPEKGKYVAFLGMHSTLIIKASKRKIPKRISVGCQCSGHQVLVTTLRIMRHIIILFF